MPVPASSTMSQSIGRAELQARRIAAVAHCFAPRTGNRSTRAPETHAEAHDKALRVVTTQTRTPTRAAKRVRSRPSCDGHHKAPDQRRRRESRPVRATWARADSPARSRIVMRAPMDADQSGVLELAHGARDGLAAGADHLRDDLVGQRFIDRVGATFLGRHPSRAGRSAPGHPAGRVPRSSRRPVAGGATTRPGAPTPRPAFASTRLRKSSRRSTSSVESSIAMTWADRGWSSISDSSPKCSLTPSTPRMTSRPSSATRTTLTRPARTMNSESPGSSSNRMTLPFGYCFSRVTSANRRSSSGAIRLSRGTVARKSAMSPYQPQVAVASAPAGAPANIIPSQRARRPGGPRELTPANAAGSGHVIFTVCQNRAHFEACHESRHPSRLRYGDG